MQTENTMYKSESSKKWKKWCIYYTKIREIGEEIF